MENDYIRIINDYINDLKIILLNENVKYYISQFGHSLKTAEDNYGSTYHPYVDQISYLKFKHASMIYHLFIENYFKREDYKNIKKEKNEEKENKEEINLYENYEYFENNDYSDLEKVFVGF